MRENQRNAIRVIENRLTQAVIELEKLRVNRPMIPLPIIREDLAPVWAAAISALLDEQPSNPTAHSLALIETTPENVRRYAQNRSLGGEWREWLEAYADQLELLLHPEAPAPSMLSEQLPKVGYKVRNVRTGEVGYLVRMEWDEDETDGAGLRAYVRNIEDASHEWHNANEIETL